MPSTLVGFQSGGQPIVSGNPYSGRIAPVGGVQLLLGANASGTVYVGTALGLSSGGITIQSGGDLSSGGLSDGLPIDPGGGLFIPALKCSGQIDKILVAVPPAVSGRCRLYWEAF